MISRNVPVIVLSLLASCVSYAPVGLRQPSAVLTAPDQTVLSTSAALIKRPYLTPEPIDLSQPVTPNALAIIAVLENPDLRALRLKLGVSEAQAFAARLLPDPTTVVGFDKLISGPDTFLAFANQLGFDLGTLLKRHVTTTGARAAQTQVRLDIAWAEWQTVGAARLQGARLLALTSQLRLAQASASSADGLLVHATRAALNKDISSADVDVRRLAALDANDKLRVTERDLGVARLELNRLLGLPPLTQLRLASVPPPADPPTAETLVAHAVDERLDLQALRSGAALAENDVHKAVLDQFPSLSLTVATARDTANNYTIGPQLGFTLPLWNRNRGGIAVAKATRAQVYAEYEARLFQTRAEITAAVDSLATLKRQRQGLAQALPSIEMLAASSAAAARHGDIARVVAESAQQTLRDRQLTLATLDQQTAELTIALELLSGSPHDKWTK